MPLTQEEIAEVTNSFNIIDADKKGFLNKQQIISLFSDLKIHLTDEQAMIVADGMLSCQTKGTLKTCINTVSLIHDEDELGFLKICFRGVDIYATRSVSLDQAVRISQIVERPKRAEDFSKFVTNSNDPKFSFSNLADVILDMKIPENVDPFNGMDEKSSCCELI